MGNAIIPPRTKYYNRLHKAPSFSSIFLWSYRGDLLYMENTLQHPENCQIWLAIHGSEVRERWYPQTVCVPFWPGYCYRWHAVLQCKIKFIASFPLGFGNGLGWGYVTEKFIPFGVWVAEPELEAELKGGGGKLLVPELGRGVVNRSPNDPEDRALLVSLPE